MPLIARKAAVDTVDSPDGSPGTPCPDGRPKCDAPSTQYTAAGSSDVFIMGVGVVREGDAMIAHQYVPCGCPSHAPVLTTFSSRVYANGLRIGRVGDAYGGDHPISSGAPTVSDGSAQA
jgi:uncharacterized Zn-binding protein involved in type VI secretion